MKTKKLSKKLFLNRKTIVNLSKDLNKVKGGETGTCAGTCTCPTYDPGTCINTVCPGICPPTEFYTCNQFTCILWECT